MKTINLLNLICLILIIIGFGIGIIPLIGSLAPFGLIPLIILSIIFSAVGENKLWIFGIINLILAGITFIPLAGTIAAIAGLILSIIALVKLVKISKE